MNFQMIETSRLLLKGISHDVMKNIFNQLEKSQIMDLLGHRSDEDFLKEEFKHKNGYSCYNRGFVLFLLVEKTSGKIIGRCGIHNWNLDHNRAEIGYVMEDEGYRKMGLMSEAVNAIIGYAFNVIKLNRLEAIVGKANVPSIKIIENNNFKKEGLLRQYFYESGKFEDAVLYSMLLSEYMKEYLEV